MADEKTMDRDVPDRGIAGDLHDPNLTIPAAEDRKVERAALDWLLDAYPDRLTILELSLAMNAGEVDLGREDAVERAVRELVGAGLLHCCCGQVLPTRAALYYRRLED